jgi:acyl-homoserine lactone acylase PvdQ
MPTPLRRALVAAAALILLAPAAASAQTTRDFASTALNIIPSGQQGSVPVPAGADRQARMYDALTPKFDDVTSADLHRDFKSERFGTSGECPCRTERVPRDGVRVVRDRFAVPHITAKTVDAMTFTAGWISAEDRALLLEQARFDSRVAAIDAPNLSAIALIAGLRNFVPSAQTETEIAKQTAVIRRTGRRGRRLLHDIDVYISGINAQLRSVNSPSRPWTRNDIYALNALKDQFFGEGGGDEARRSMFLAGLQQRLGPQSGQLVFDDLRQRDPADTPVSIGGTFPYAQVPGSKAGNLVVDPNTLQLWRYAPAGGTSAPGTTLRGAQASLPAAAPTDAAPHASNVLMLSGKRSRNGHPLFVGGPQIGYFYPGLTMEMDMHAPGVDVRGATSPAFPGYMLIGRGPDFAWTLTSAGADDTDQFVETLCGGDDVHYVFRGQCRAMTSFDAGVLRGTNGQPDQRVTFFRTVHGPVVGYANVGGRRVAISSQRASYGRDTVDQLPYQDLTLGRVRSPQDFVRSMLRSPQTFNAFYADDRHIAEVTTGLLPLRAPDVDPGLPTNGDGNHEWRGFLAAAGHPQQIDPQSGEIVNWNNQPARGFEAADNRWNYGLSHRVDLLNRNVAKRQKHSLTTLVGAMNAAATQDLRAIDVVPELAVALRGATPPSPRARQMLSLLRTWRNDGGSRLDRDGDGKIDDPGAAIMDAAWPRIADAVMGPVLGPQLDELAALEPRFEQPPGGQAAGWHSYVLKDLHDIFGPPTAAPFRVRYCGAGNAANCRTALWAAIDAAGNDLAGAQGPNPAAWRADATKERISFVPGLLKTTLRYTNRSSGIQQVISFRGHRASR